MNGKPSSKKPTIKDAQGYAPKVGDEVVAHYMGEASRIYPAKARVKALRDDGTVDLAVTLANREVTLEGCAPKGDGRFSVGWTRTLEPEKAPAAKAESGEKAGDSKPAGSAGEKEPPQTPSQKAGAASNSSPLKPVD